MLVDDPKKLRVLADPVRQRILGCFAEPTTVGEAAKTLGLSGKGIYRHIDLLLESGFLIVVSTRQKRGTVERTLQTAARRFVGQVGDSEGLAGPWSDFIERLRAVGKRQSAENGSALIMNAAVTIDPEKWEELETELTSLLNRYESPKGKSYSVLLAAIQDE